MLFIAFHRYSTLHYYIQFLIVSTKSKGRQYTPIGAVFKAALKSHATGLSRLALRGKGNLGFKPKEGNGNQGGSPGGNQGGKPGGNQGGSDGGMKGGNPEKPSLGAYKPFLTGHDFAPPAAAFTG